MSKLGDILEDSSVELPDDLQDTFEDPIVFEMLSLHDLIDSICAEAGSVIAEDFKQFACFSKYPKNPDILIEVLSKRSDYFSKQCLEKLMEFK